TPTYAGWTCLLSHAVKPCATELVFPAPRFYGPEDSARECGSRIRLGAAELAPAWAPHNRGVAREDQAQPPIARHLQLLLQSHEFVEVNRVPEQPREVAAHLDASQVDHSKIHPQRDQHA